MDFLQRVRTNYLKICVESEKTLNSQGNFTKEHKEMFGGDRYARDLNYGGGFIGVHIC